jgi:hypothetical protein
VQSNHPPYVAKTEQKRHFWPYLGVFQRAFDKALCLVNKPRQPNRLGLNSNETHPYHFDPLVGEPSLPVELTASYRPGTPALYLVQFFGRSKDEWFADLEANRAEVLQYVASETCLARMTPRRAARIEKLEFIRWVGPYHPAYRISPYLWEYVGTVESGVIENVSMMIYDDGQAGGTVDGTIREIEALGGKLIDRSRSRRDSRAYVTFVLPASAITPTATLNNLLWQEYSLSEVILE